MRRRSASLLLLLLGLTFPGMIAANPLKGVGPQVFLHTAADVQPEDLEKQAWDGLMKQVVARLQEAGFEVHSGDWFAAQREFEGALTTGLHTTEPGARIIVSLSVLKDPQSRYVYSARLELRELGYFVRPAGKGYVAQDQQLHGDLAFFSAGEDKAPPRRITQWKAMQSGDVASYATPGVLGYAAWDSVQSAVLGEVDRFAREWKRAQ